MEEQSKHQSVLAEEVIKLLSPLGNRVILDATFGGGGHSRLLLEKCGRWGKVVALDRDPTVAKYAQSLSERWSDNFSFFPYNYTQADSLGLKFDRALMDLGLSSDQLESGRGFSYQKDEYLDMRYNPRSGIDASNWLNSASLKELQQVFSQYAQDRFSASLARKIIKRRLVKKFKTTNDLVEAVGTDNPKVLSPIFQAIRIRINDELDCLKNGLEVIDRVLKEGGKLAVISFHSGEDRLVKNFFKNKKYKMITKKPIKPELSQIQNNPRCRSALLRVGEKVDEA